MLFRSALSAEVLASAGRLFEARKNTRGVGGLPDALDDDLAV